MRASLDARPAGSNLRRRLHAGRKQMRGGFGNGGRSAVSWNPAREAVRQEANAWIRQGRGFDAVIDFDQAVRDPDRLTSMLPIYDCGDHLHQNDRGYNHMGDVIDLSLFE
jgi:hypothetical protein